MGVIGFLRQYTISNQKRKGFPGFGKRKGTRSGAFSVYRLQIVCCVVAAADGFHDACGALTGAVACVDHGDGDAT